METATRRDQGLACLHLELKILTPSRSFLNRWGRGDGEIVALAELTG